MKGPSSTKNTSSWISCFSSSMPLQVSGWALCYLEFPTNEKCPRTCEYLVTFKDVKHIVWEGLRSVFLLICQENWKQLSIPDYFCEFTLALKTCELHEENNIEHVMHCILRFLCKLVVTRNCKEMHLWSKERNSLMYHFYLNLLFCVNTVPTPWSWSLKHWWCGWSGKAG